MFKGVSKCHPSPIVPASFGTDVLDTFLRLGFGLHRGVPIPCPNAISCFLLCGDSTDVRGEFARYLGLSDDVPLARPREASGQELQTAHTLLKDCGLEEGSTVILSPEARSGTMVHPTWWIKLRDRLQARGLGVAVNFTTRSPPISGCVPLRVSLRQLWVVSRVAGRAITLRSGTSDLLATSGCALDVLYPVQQVGKLGRKFRDTFSVNRLWQTARAREFSIPYRPTDGLLREIVT